MVATVDVDAFGFVVDDSVNSVELERSGDGLVIDVVGEIVLVEVSSGSEQSANTRTPANKTTADFALKQGTLVDFIGRPI